MSAIELLQTHGAVIDELLGRGVVKTRNNPVGDYTEWLVCQRLGLEMAENSQAAFDAVDVEGVRYQIKGRRAEGTSVQFSAIRNLADRGFDFVIAVVFNLDYSIRFAVMIPYGVVREFATYREHVKAQGALPGPRQHPKEVRRPKYLPGFPGSTWRLVPGSSRRFSVNRRRNDAVAGIEFMAGARLVQLR